MTDRQRAEAAAEEVSKAVLRDMRPIPDAVRKGIEQARRGEFAEGPDLESDAKVFDDTDDDGKE